MTALITPALLRGSVDSGNFEIARSVLRSRDPDTGRPTIDINRISESNAVRTALNYTIGSENKHTNSQARYQIAYEILSIRDIENTQS